MVAWGILDYAFEICAAEGSPPHLETQPPVCSGMPCPHPTKPAGDPRVGVFFSVFPGYPGLNVPLHHPRVPSCWIRGSEPHLMLEGTTSHVGRNHISCWKARVDHQETSRPMFPTLLHDTGVGLVVRYLCDA
jgi:hypothetical protein